MFGFLKGEEANYSGEEEGESNRKKVKHTLDSDEEDDTEKYEVLRREALNGRAFSFF
jgi:hypothetical protein